MAAVAASAASGGRQHMKEKATELLEMNIDQASVQIRTGEIDNPKVYCSTCMKLGSAIDSAIAVNAFPSSSSHLLRLPLIVKEVYRRKTELLQPSLMLLMLPIKAACEIGWFLDGEKYGLLMIAKEVSYGLSDTDKMNIEPNNAHSTVTDIVSRFYPTMKVEHVLTSFDVKAGYGIYVADFHLSMGTTPRHCKNLWLLVAQLDDMDTAACITNPLNVDFLINGSRVPNRTKNNMGKGPQLPSNITKLIKYGLNLLQVFGDFDGRYIIALAFMNSISTPDPSLLQDYLNPMSDGVNSNCDTSEMSSRISLYCPVSRYRIKTPAKGHLCKHPQCFDYNYFIEVNSTKPTWRCPLCDNPVCYQDIRVDQDFVKILNEAANDVEDVFISQDGSWMVAETIPEVSLGQTQVNECTTNIAQNTTVITPSAVSVGQTRVEVCTTTQAKSTTMFTPLAVSSGQIQVNACTTNQAQSTTMLTPPAAPSGQTQAQTMFTPPAGSGSAGQTQVNACTNSQVQSTTKFTPPTAVTVIKPAVTPGQSQVNACTTPQAKSTNKFTPSPTVTKPAVSPGQTQVNVCTTPQAKSTTMLTPPATVTKPAVSPGQSQLNFCTTTQAKSTIMFTPPAVSPGQSQLNFCTTPQAKSTTTMYEPPTPGDCESQPVSNKSCVLPTQHGKASGGDAMPSGRMRGSLRGDQLEAAKLHYLAPPQQQARANEPWSRPPIPSLSSLLLKPRTPTTNSENVGNSK